MSALLVRPVWTPADFAATVAAAARVVPVVVAAVDGEEQR
jgi:hypothetical protein